jgi:hypothetical protein
MFSFDNRFCLPLDYPGYTRGLVGGDWTYAVYLGLDGSGLECEFCDRKTNPRQLNNPLCDPAITDVKKEWPRPHRMLAEGLIDAAN